ncbi:flagellar biosynthesis anti-sigma factor FlgM [Ralstonia sp. ASV6]|uniref:flagellar biosynthesis anti-sigma factor FlgM n=1 Tax=Ralstonia sp. ASV6 TaxID=2795124 RepID=UPI0018EB54DF|nr:flagellar biosynthesis anti-sigma factor FlgM [Ralstonia sp. ASV6]
MRIANAAGLPAINEPDSTPRADAVKRTEAPVPTMGAADKTRDREAIEAARAALDRTPEVDAARVAEIRAALQAGEIRFDAAKLAGVIQRYHGGHE